MRCRFPEQACDRAVLEDLVGKQGGLYLSRVAKQTLRDKEHLFQVTVTELFQLTDENQPQMAPEEMLAFLCLPRRRKLSNKAKPTHQQGFQVCFMEYIL